ncbi:hypothetical protein ACFQPF_14145 [Fictibacillus iocasae]|uniref:Uncharacterized protein n=1 Tax=Fictibacillus iocasae TaxID=2715437 RepID=A0ABW2NQT2_9BACL
MPNDVEEVVDLRFRRTLSARRGEKQKWLVQPRQANEKGTGKSVCDLLGTFSFDLEGLAISAGQIEKQKWLVQPRQAEGEG